MCPIWHKRQAQIDHPFNLKPRPFGFLVLFATAAISKDPCRQISSAGEAPFPTSCVLNTADRFIDSAFIWVCGANGNVWMLVLGWKWNRGNGHLADPCLRALLNPERWGVCISRFAWGRWKQATNPRPVDQVDRSTGAHRRPGFAAPHEAVPMSKTGCRSGWSA